ALLVFLGSLVAYNFGLKAEYLSVNKRGLTQYNKDNRFNNYDRIPVSNFDDIDIKAGNALNINIEYGEKSTVWLRKWTKERIQISQNGNKLIVDLTEKGKLENFISHDYTIIIFSPKIKKLSTSSFTYIEKGKETNQNRGGFGTMVSGFMQDSIALNVQGMTKIKLNKNELKYVSAVVGNEKGDGTLTISPENEVETLKLKANGRSTIEILNKDVQHVEHDISEGAIISFRGKALPKLYGK
ncbi:MAG: DUF2807 domain-containing protein, partial [Pyrinomonadaceae bacterium]|nr:DUF2807 domain-containing protein [Sphingobacteriaceae bacterium]